MNENELWYDKRQKELMKDNLILEPWVERNKELKEFYI